MHTNNDQSQSRLMLRVAAAVAVLAATVSVVSMATAAASTGPLPVTPYSGFNSILARAPYVTDLTQTTAYVNWGTTSMTPGSVKVAATVGGACPSSTTIWSSSAVKSPTSLPGPVNPTGGGGSSSMTGWKYSVVNGSGTSTNEYQNSVELTGLDPSTQYCYGVFSSDKSSAVNLLPSNEPAQDFTTLDPVSTSSTKSLTFDVMADTGENYEYTGGSGASSDVPFPGGVNPDQAAIDEQIGTSGARFLLIAGDIAYNGGTESTYGDLENTGTDPEVSNIFGSSYFPETGGIPTFAATGNHGQNVTTLKTWPTPVTAATSGGTYAFDSYSGVDDIDGTFPDDWYAFSTGNVRIYVLDGSWADGTSGPTGTGDATGSLCSTPSYCTGYQADADEHWQTSSPEYQWLEKDLATHPGGIKFAVWHYPLRSDNATQPSDPYLQNSPANPNASSSLEALLAENGVDIAFNGHAHTYQRIVPKQVGQIINYVTGGGGGVLEPVLGGSTCSNLANSETIVALGWSPSKTTADGGTGSACNASKPGSAAQVYNFLKVTVSGDTVTVTPTNAAGQTFDQQTYTFSSSSPPNDFSIDASPSGGSVAEGSSTTSTIQTTVTSGSAQSVSLSATGAPAGAQVSFNPQVINSGQTSTMTVATSASTPVGNSTITVTGAGADSTQSTPYSLSVTSSSGGGPKLVQSAGATESSSATSLTASFNSATTAGDLLVVSAGVYTGATDQISSITDSAGNTWKRIGAYDSSGHYSDGELWYAANANPVTNVTAHSTSEATIAMEVEEFSGISSATPLDSFAGASNTGTTASSGTATPSASSELVVGFVAGHGNTEPITITSSGYTTQPQQTSTGTVTSVITAYQVLGSAAPEGISGTFSTAMYWAAGVAIFKPGG